MSATAYETFLESKTLVVRAQGPAIESGDIHPTLFGFQRDLVRWSVRKGRCAIFADTGLGKSRMQIEWARLIGGRSLIVAPLSVARQTVREAALIDVHIHYTRSGDDLSDGINITNYEMLSHFDANTFGSVVLDESSILKSLDGKTRQRLTEMFEATPYRLCCTATPAPNDIAEIANHAEFLGIMTRTEMMASFFVHDDEGWRLKRPAQEPFYRWLASWGMSIRKPSDLGYPDDGYDLPPLSIKPVFVDTEFTPTDSLFFTGLKGITDRSRVRKGTMEERVAAAAEMVNADEEQWIVWCGLNDESTALARAIPDAVEVTGAMDPDAKVRAIEEFQDGRIRVLVTKAKIAGFGLNLQNARKMAFVGLSDSWEAYYQCVRRCWRFGQTRPVEAYIVLSEPERPIYENVMRKEEEATKMADSLIQHVAAFEREEIGEGGPTFDYHTDTVRALDYTAMLGDSVERLAEVESDSVGLSVFSPPFMSLYTYSPTERDLGNCKGEDQFFDHFGYIIDHLLRVTMPGRLCCVHVAQVPAMLARDGYIGLKDFRGATINAFVDHGWIHHGEVCIDKDPQAQAIRTKSKSLLFTQLHKDSSWSRPALADFILVFRKPGENKQAVHPDITNDEWIEWARPIWYNIRESDTLQYSSARGEEDERHICPLQLGTIERCVKLWSNEGDLVCDPFGGIGSTGWVALRNGRRAVTCELKPSYYQILVRNLREAANSVQPSLFDEVAV